MNADPILETLADSRITLVIHSMAGGGAERQMSYLAKYLVKTGARLTLITFDDGASDVYPIDARVNRVCLNVMYPSKNKIAAFFANWKRRTIIRDAVAASSPDLIISFCDKTNITTLAACRSLGIPIMISERSDPRKQNLGIIWEFLRKQTYPKCFACVAQTTGVANYLRSIVGPKCRIFVIPSAIEIEKEEQPGLTRQASESIPAKAVGKQRMLFVGRLSKEKGPDRLLRCWRSISNRHADWELLFVGNGEMRAELESFANANRLNTSVTFAGWQTEMNRIWQTADAFVLPSEYEGFPNALLESLWNEVPPIATLCSDSIHQIIQHGSNGLIAANDEQSLELNLDRLLSEKSLRDKIRSHSKASVAPFLWSNVADQWYRAIVGAIATKPE